MADRRKFKVAVTELLRKVVVVEAKDETEAHQRVSDAWQNGEYTLDERDFDGAEFHVLGESDGEEEKHIVQVDRKDTEVAEDAAF